MKIFTTIHVVTALLFSTLVYAEPSGGVTDHEKNSALKTLSEPVEAVCQEIVNVTVNGLVCDFCAISLEKIFNKREEVAGINVDLDNGLIKVVLRPGQSIDDETLAQLISDSGYAITAIDKGC